MIKKRHWILILTILLICGSLSCFNYSHVYAASKIAVDDYAEGKLDSYDDKEYTLTLKHKTKVKFNVTTWANEEDEYDDLDDEYDDLEDVIYFSIYDNEEYEYIKDIELDLYDEKNFTATLDKGSYTIRLSCYEDNVNYSVEINDVSEYSKKVTMNSELTLYKGNSKTLSVKSKESGKLVGDITWSTSNKKIATVTKTGKVTGKKAGTCTISAKVKGANTVKCKVVIKARPQLYIKEAGFGINFLDGVEPYIKLQNNFGKTIKYIYFDVYFYNTVGDPAYCDIKGTYKITMSITGPIKNGNTGTYYWDPVIYNSTTGKMYIKTAKVIFMDGKTKTLTIKKSFK